MPDNTSDRVRVYDTRTGEKLTDPVPRDWLRIYPHLSETPTSREAAKKAARAQSENKEG